MKLGRLGNDNKGYTLIELVVVITILCVMATTIGLSTGVIHKNKVKEAANTVDSMLSACKVSSVSGEGIYCRLELYYNSAGVKKEGFYVRYYTTSDTSPRAEEYLKDVRDIQVQIGATTTSLKNSPTVTVKYDGQTCAIVGDQVKAIKLDNMYSIEIHPKTGYHETKRIG